MPNKTKEAMDAIIKKLEPIVRENKDQSLVLGALLFWVIELIKKGSAIPDKTAENVCDLIKAGVQNDEPSE